MPIRTANAHHINSNDLCRSAVTVVSRLRFILSHRSILSFCFLGHYGGAWQAFVIGVVAATAFAYVCWRSILCTVESLVLPFSLASEPEAVMGSFFAPTSLCSWSDLDFLSRYIGESMNHQIYT